MRRALLPVILAALSGCAGQAHGVPPSATASRPVASIGAVTLAPTAVMTFAPTRIPLLPPTDTPSAKAQRAPEPTVEPAPAVHVAGSLLAGRPTTGTIDDMTPAALYTFIGQAGDIVNLSLKARSGDLEARLLILDPEGRELARDDASDGTGDAAIRGLQLPASGVYTVVAARSLQGPGSTQGDFALRYDPADADAQPSGVFSRAITYGSFQDGALNDTSPAQVFTFSGSAGDIVTIQVSVSSGDLQPVIKLTDGQGALVEQSRAADDPNQPDAILQRVQLPQTGSYSIEVARPQDQAQSVDFRLRLTLEQAGGLDALRDAASAWRRS